MKSRRSHSLSALFLLAGMILAPLAWLSVYGAPPVPANGVYLGVLLDQGGTLEEMQQFNAYAGKNQAVFGKFVVFKRDPFPTNWINAVKSVSPGCGAHIILEPVTDFADFFSPSWGPGQATYEAAKSFAISCRDAGLPIFLRFGHEANGWWYPWSPSYSGSDGISNETYIQGFQNCAALFHSIATNVAMVWAPNQGNGPGEVPYYAHVYPGDDAVDWVGMSVYNGEWYGNSNNVMDYQFRNSIQRGYWQYDTNALNDTDVDFYWEFSDPNNPSGHHKPMMIAETSAQFVPQFQIDSTTAIATFEDLNSDGRVASSYLSVDSFETLTPWNWGPWGNLSMPLTTVCADGTYGVLLSGNPTGDYIGGNGRNSPFTDWSVRNGMEIWVKRENSTEEPDPLLQIGIRSRAWDESYVAKVGMAVSGTDYYPLKILFSEINVPAGFLWSDIKALTFELLTTETNQQAGDLYVDQWRLANITVASYADQDWWPAGSACTPWGDITWVQSTDRAEGTYALRMSGTDADGDWYIGGNACSLVPAQQNWSTNNALVLYAKCGNVAGRPAPELKITLDNDYTDLNGNEASIKTKISNTNYTQIVIGFGDLDVGAGFNWSQVQVVKLELFTSVGGQQPNDLYVDHLRRASVTLLNGADNEQWKMDWIDQLYALENYADSDPREWDDYPDFVNISTAFPNLHMINWFHVRKFEDGMTKDFEIPADGGSPLYNYYYHSISNSYFLSQVVGGGTSTGIPLIASFAINNGAVVTTSRQVVLNNTYSGGTPTDFMFSESPGFAGGFWCPYAGNPVVLLSSGNGLKTMYLKLKNESGESPVVSDDITLNDQPSNPAGTLSFQANYSFTEPGTYTVAVNRIGGQQGVVSVNYWMNNGTATAGEDYVWVYDTLTFGDGVSVATIPVTILDDCLEEPEETFYMVLGATTGGAELGTPSVAEVRIMDDEEVAELPFMDDFESGTLPGYWSRRSCWIPSGIECPNAVGVSDYCIPSSGSNFLMLSGSYTGTCIRGDATLAVNLEDCHDVVLSFMARRYGDQPSVDGPPPIPFTGSADFDGVAISQNGTTWYYVAPLTTNIVTGMSPYLPFTHVEVDLDAAAASYGLEYASRFYIRFNGVVCSCGPFDGICIDDVSISGTRLPTVMSYSINSGAEVATSRTAVILNNLCSGDPIEYRAGDSTNLSGASWLAYSTAPTYPVSQPGYPGSGSYTIYFQVKNAAGESAVVGDTIGWENAPGMSWYGIGACDGCIGTTLTRTVTLTAYWLPDGAGKGPAREYMASESPGFTGAIWYPYTNTPSFTLSSGNGTKTVYLKARNYGGESAVDSATVVLAEPPVVASFTINNGAASANYLIVTLNNTWSGGQPTQYMASESPSFSGASWQSYSSAPEFLLSASNGTKTVYLKLKNDGGESAVSSDSILLSQAAPVIYGFSIDAGAATTSDREVWLMINETGGGWPYGLATQKMVSESPTFDGAVWTPHYDGFVFTLSSGNGTKTVYCKIRNDGGESAVSNATIILAEPPVVASFAINNGEATTPSLSVTLDNTYSGGAPTEYMASESSSFSGATWQPYSAAPSFTLSAGDGTKTVYLKLRNLGGESAVVSDTIIPAVPVLAELAWFTINDGAALTASREVVLEYGWYGQNPTNYIVSESSSFSGASWQTWHRVPTRWCSRSRPGMERRPFT